MPYRRRGSRPHTSPLCQSQAQKAHAHPGPAAHTGTWPRLACLGKQRQPAVLPHLGEPLSAALRRCHPGLSRSCSEEKGGSQPHRAIVAPVHSQTNWRKQAAEVWHNSPAHARSQQTHQVGPPLPCLTTASLNQAGDQPNLLVLSPVPSTSPSTGAWAGGQEWRLASELCRPLLLAIILRVRRPRAHTLPQRPAKSRKEPQEEPYRTHHVV